jgi:hypothetical protein
MFPDICVLYSIGLSQLPSLSFLQTFVSHSKQTLRLTTSDLCNVVNLVNGLITGRRVAAVEIILNL